MTGYDASAMAALEEKIKRIAAAQPYKITASKPSAKEIPHQKIVIEKKKNGYQAAAYTPKQVFHQNFPAEELADYLTEYIAGRYLQVNAWDEEQEHILLCSRKGAVTYRTKTAAGNRAKSQENHNRKKQYLLEEGTVIPPLADMGIFTAEGKIAASMHDKYRQINRFLELIDDVVRKEEQEELRIVDFGCGKSYLTFILYYYFTEIRKRRVTITGLDLKEDVIADCNAAAKKYGYEGLHFEVGDISVYQSDAPVDMVVTLHACDTATDYALYHAIRWGARMIFSVPCCQHELNRQIQSKDYALMTRYGIIKERFSALVTDAIRGNLLECCGYQTQLLEFVDFAHTPKNILIRAVKRDAARQIVPVSVKKKYLGEVERMMEEFHLAPTLYGLLKEDGRIGESIYE